ncbi:hypothetical protein LH51_09670 [Nitrincola sp. A-D6]|uniref:hypothetical protein n=1 Tax=Nitrincola sp. A-D6 TaxID=1545442 RepID=UPI00051FBB12|nr:hypothetical protein [Nitrincola sp. A-D6]KGK42099.1 hypothetical protein LH51_09670 [Nitrincola sp. A-D6]
MNAIEQWKYLTRQANEAFGKQCNAVAETLYKRSIQLMQQVLESQDDVQNTHEKSGMTEVICLSISVQNLADLYARQERWTRCLSILETYQTRFKQASEALCVPPSTALTLIQESGRLRREGLRHFENKQHPLTAPERTWVEHLPMTARVH